jgi:hypothetical protein
MKWTFKKRQFFPRKNLKIGHFNRFFPYIKRSPCTYEHETGPRAFLHSLIPLEQYCKRRLLLKKHVERIEYTGDPLLPLREYPVREILALYALGHAVGYGMGDFAGTGEMPEDTVYSLSLSPVLKHGR